MLPLTPINICIVVCFMYRTCQNISVCICLFFQTSIFDRGESVHQLAWTSIAAFKMWHGVICVKYPNHLCTATFATNICAKTVRWNISRINQKNTKWSHSKREWLDQNAKSIPLNYVNFTVNNATSLYVWQKKTWKEC